MDLTIDELTALVFQHSRRAIQARKAAAETLKLADEDDRLAQVYLEVGKRRNREREAKEGKMNIRKIISGVMVLVLMLCLLSVSSFTLAQDEPGATETPAATSEAPSGVTPVQPEPRQNDLSAVLEFLKETALIIAVVVLAFKTGALIPANVVRDVLEYGFNLANGLADTTTTQIDNKALEFAKPVIIKWVADELAKKDSMKGTLQKVDAPPFPSGSTIKPADLTAEG